MKNLTILTYFLFYLNFILAERHFLRMNDEINLNNAMNRISDSLDDLESWQLALDTKNSNNYHKYRRKSNDRSNLLSNSQDLFSIEEYLGKTNNDRHKQKLNDEITSDIIGHQIAKALDNMKLKEIKLVQLQTNIYSNKRQKQTNKKQVVDSERNFYGHEEPNVKIKLKRNGILPFLYLTVKSNEFHEIAEPFLRKPRNSAIKKACRQACRNALKKLISKDETMHSSLSKTVIRECNKKCEDQLSKHKLDSESDTDLDSASTDMSDDIKTETESSDESGSIDTDSNESFSSSDEKLNDLSISIELG